MRTSYGFLLVTNPLLPLKVQVGEPTFLDTIHLYVGIPYLTSKVGRILPFLPQLDRDSCWPPFLF